LKVESLALALRVKSLLTSLLCLIYFLTRDALLARNVRSSCVCPSVCLSVTSRHCTKMAKRTQRHMIAQGL